ncbi:MAG: F0F1 ATP synthase subunit epsilon [Rhodobacteraceae bacterium]|nr:F0F1 ATP synthase subunit epsilon [Rhodobacterales bacterium]NCX69257.1 F0F1 ATP synthase subunit epsilon [Paracoccaceae bacterium]NCX92941.1 F0F1 ATP synthase subunit epsilon [Paracoccaceae bacterium]
MVKTMQVDVVSPEKLLFSSEAVSVEIPGSDGDMTAMANHAPLITTLRPGILRVVQEKGASEYVVTGGFAELGETVSVLAEKAVLKADFDREMFDELVTAAQTALDSARASMAGDAVDMASKSLSDFNILGENLGFK